MHEAFQDLCQEAKGAFDEMIKILNEYLDSSKIALEKFEELEFRRVNENIDNT